MLHACFSESGGFHELLMSRHMETPSSPEAPWRLALYCDEVVPGNALSSDNQRKIWAFYASFLEFGAVELAQEELWMTVTIMRTSQVALVESGVSQVVAKILHRVFKNEACDVRVAGLRLKGPNGKIITLWFTFDCFVADGAAHKYVWQCKGDSGMKFCIFCRNLVAEKSKIVDDDGNDVLVCSKIERAELDQATDSDIIGTIDRLISKKDSLNSANFKLWQQACGFTFAACGVLFDPCLRDIVKPVSQYMIDWMHGVFVKGVWHTTFFLVILALQSCGIDSYAVMTEFLVAWSLPVGKLASKSHLLNLFLPKRKQSNKEAKTFKCTASDGLSLYGLVALCIQEKILPQLRSRSAQAACRAYLLLSNVIDLLAASASGLISPDDLDNAVDGFLALCKAAGWSNRMHSKFHWLLHFGQHLRQHLLLLNCWVHERRHKLVKRYSSLHMLAYRLILCI